MHINLCVFLSLFFSFFDSQTTASFFWGGNFRIDSGTKGFIYPKNKKTKKKGGEGGTPRSQQHIYIYATFRFLDLWEVGKGGRKGELRDK